MTEKQLKMINCVYSESFPSIPLLIFNAFPGLVQSKTAFTESKTRTGSHDAKSKASLPVEAEVKAESPPLVILNETGDSSPGHTPPYKKM